MHTVYYMIPIASHNRCLLRFQWQGNLPIHLPSLQSVVCSLDLYQDHIPNCNHPLVNGPENGITHRQHTSHGRHRYYGTETHSRPDILVTKPRVYNKLPQISAYPTQEINFLSFVINSATMEIKTSGEKIRKILLGSRKLLRIKCTTALTLSHLLDKFSHTTQAILLAPQLDKHVQCCLQNAVET